jgi:hypothetical protein
MAWQQIRRCGAAGLRAPVSPVQRGLHLREAAEENGAPPPGITVTVAIRDANRLAEELLNAWLGIVGGRSILGTTRIVVPYSCSDRDEDHCGSRAWHSGRPGEGVRLPRRGSVETVETVFDWLAVDHPFETAEMVS